MALKRSFISDTGESKSSWETELLSKYGNFTQKVVLKRPSIIDPGEDCSAH